MQHEHIVMNCMPVPGSPLQDLLDPPLTHRHALVSKLSVALNKVWLLRLCARLLPNFMKAVHTWVKQQHLHVIVMPASSSPLQDHFAHVFHSKLSVAVSKLMLLRVLRCNLTQSLHTFY